MGGTGDELEHYMRSTGRLRVENERLRELVRSIFIGGFEQPLRGNRAYPLLGPSPLVHIPPRQADLLREILEADPHP